MEFAERDIYWMHRALELAQRGIGVTSPNPAVGCVILDRAGQVVGATGIVLTKLDGTAKSGIAVAIARELNLPVRFVGIGEKMTDLLEFSAADFVDSLL